MADNLTYAPSSSEIPPSTPDPAGQLYVARLENKFHDLTSSPEVDTAIQDNGGNQRPFGTDLTSTPAYQSQEQRVKAMIYDPVNLGGQADQAVLNSQKNTDPQGYRDQVAAYAAVSHLTGAAMSDVVDNYGWYQAQLEKHYKFDPTDNVGTFRKNLQGVFEQHDSRAGAIDALKTQAVQDAFSDAEKGMSVPPLKRFNDWQSAHQDALKGLSDSDKLAAFNSVYKPTQASFNTPDGQLAKKFVDALTGNTPEAKANNYSKEFPTYTDPRTYLRGLPNDQLNTVLGLAQQYVKATHMGEGVGNLGSVYNAFVNSAESFNRYGEVSNLLQAEKARNAATTPEEKQKYQDQYNDILLAQKVRTFDQSVINAPPVHKGWKGFVSDTATGLAGLIPQVVPFLVPVMGEIAFGANEIANETLKRLAENPNMSASEANWRSLVPAAVNTVVGTKGIHLLGKVAPTVVGVLKHTAGSTLMLSAGNLAKTLYAQLEHAWNKDINAGEDFAQEYWNILKETPSLFIQLGIMGGAMHVLSGGGKVDPEVAKQAAKNAADPMVLKEAGFSHEEATRISQLPEDQRLKAITDGWKKRTEEDIKAGEQLRKDNYQQVLDIINSPDAPKLVNNYDGTFHVVTTTPEGETHTVSFSDRDAAETAYTDAMREHLIAQHERTMRDGNDWTTSTSEDAKTVLDEGRTPTDPSVTIHVPELTDTSSDPIKTPDEQLTVTVSNAEAQRPITKLNGSLASQASGKDGTGTVTRVRAATGEELDQLRKEPSYLFADRIARIFGQKLVLYKTESGDAGNGLINTSFELRGYVFLNIDGDRPHLFTLGHELWHSLSEQYPDLAKKLKDQLLPMIKDMGRVDLEKRLYQPEERVDEVIADFLGNNLGNKDMWDRLQKADPTLFKTVAGAIKQWLDTIIQKLHGYQMGSNSHFNDLEKARDLLAQTLHEWAISERVEPSDANDAMGVNKFQRDDEYDAAVKSGDTESQQRLVDEAAKEAGAIMAWHGTNAEFSSYDMDKAGSNTGGFLPIKGMFFSTDKNHSSHLPEGEKNKYRKRAYIVFQNPFVGKNWDSLGRHLGGDITDWDDGKGERGLERLKQLGNDGYVLANGDEILVTHPSQIKSADPITRDSDGNVIPLSQRFNSESNDIRFQKDEVDFKDVTKKIPEVVKAAKDYRDKKISQEEYIKLVERYMPYREMDSVPKPATKSELMSSLKDDQRKQVGHALKYLKDGDMVGLRLDIPAYRDYGVWIVSVHDANGVKLGKIVGYEPVAIANDVVFISNPDAALGIATDELHKNSFARMLGAWEASTPTSAKTEAEAAIKDPSYVQLGMNPARHSWFYDRKTGQPVIGADRVIQVGGLVLAKNPKYTTPQDPRFYSKKHGVLFQKDDPKEDFYSQLQKTVSDKMPNKASVEQIRAIIDPAKGSGVKPDEIKWSNLDGFLEGKKTVTKAEVLDYLKNEGSVKFEEKVLGGVKKRWTQEDLESLKEEARISENYSAYDQAVREYLADAQNRENNPKHSTWVLPNGENYREVVLTLPTANTEPLEQFQAPATITALPEGWYVIQDQNGMNKGQGFGIIPAGQKHAQGFGGQYWSTPEIATAKALELLNQNSYWKAKKAFDQRQKEKADNGNTYTSPHFSDIPNYVAHMRLDERKDASGKDGLFIEEIQSDRHQKGRERGYAGENGEYPFTVRTGDEVLGNFKTHDEAQDFAVKYRDTEKDYNVRVHGTEGIPDAPFRKDWSIQMFKRALRDAVASGKEWIGWTKGIDQVDRYEDSIRQSVDSIEWTKSSDGTTLVNAIKRGKSTFAGRVGTDGKFPSNHPQAGGKTLDEVIGKGMAEKIMSGGDTGTLNGKDLTIGGEGMKGFYDQILPNEIGKYVKKWGAKVEEGVLPIEEAKQKIKGSGTIWSTPDDAYRIWKENDGTISIQKLSKNGYVDAMEDKDIPISVWDKYDEVSEQEINHTPIWKVSITPEMRQTISEGGQTLFQKNTPIITGKTPPPPTLREKSEETLRNLQRTIRDLPAASPFKKSLLKWSSRSQQSTNEIERAQHEVEKVAPNLVTREGITNWLEAGGDKTLLRLRAKTAIEKYKAGYEAALNFTPEQEALANKIKSTFDILLKRGNSWGLDLGTRENYVPHVYKTEPQAPSGSTPKRLSEFFKFSQERTFDTYHEGESNGYQPETKDIAKLLGLYMNDMSNAINSRRFVEELRGLKASDGRPLLSGRGSGKDTTTDKGTTHLVYPDAADEGTEDYKKLDQPALHDWKFAGKADDGSMILSKGDLAVHPEIATHLNNALSSSAITRWINSKTGNPFLNATKSVANFGLKAQGYAKGTMLSFSPFHQVQEGIHAIGHRINPFAGLPKIDLRNPDMKDAADHGLMLAHDRLSQSLFMEGVGDNNSNLITMGLRKIGWGLGGKAADTVDAYQHYLFSQYIPSLKFQTYTHILERNMDRYKKDLAKGTVDEWQIKNLSARQSNAAYGHLNYTDMGHNPTIRHALQIILLAPDFLEARGRFVAQAAKGLVGGKVGAEQLQALAFLAIVQFVGARIFNKLTNDDYEWEHPFEIRVGNKYYGLRSVPEDMYKLATNTTGFIGGRISPIFGRFVQEGVFGVNYRGEHTTVGNAIADIIAGIVPMSMQSMVGQWTQTGKANPISWWEQMLTSAGVQIHRYSPITTMYPLAKKWVHANYPENDQKGSSPVSKFQQLRYALEDSNEESVAKQMKILDESGMSHHEITRGFTASVNHPFTGSRATDKQWVKTLDEDDLQRYKAAVERKKEILRRYHHMTGHHPVSNPVEDEQNPQ